jgi:hypothetical protein
MPVTGTPKEAGEVSMLIAVVAVLLVGTVAGSIDADRGDGCYRTSCYQRDYHGSNDAYGGCGGYPGCGGYGGRYGACGNGGCGGYDVNGGYGSSYR